LDVIERNVVACTSSVQIDKPRKFVPPVTAEDGPQASLNERGKSTVDRLQRVVDQLTIA